MAYSKANFYSLLVSWQKHGTKIYGGHIILNFNICEDYTEYLISSSAKKRNEWKIYVKAVLMPNLKIQLVNLGIFAY
jgi:hypothetical protein